MHNSGASEWVSGASITDKIEHVNFETQLNRKKRSWGVSTSGASAEREARRRTKSKGRMGHWWYGFGNLGGVQISAVIDSGAIRKFIINHIYLYSSISDTFSLNA